MIGKDFDNMEGITLEKQTSSCILLKEKLPLKLKENSKRSLLSTAGELKSEFFVTENLGRNSILSYNICVELGIIHIVAEETNTKIQD